jgi:nucleoside 2-deoxyribosyltransferase
MRRIIYLAGPYTHPDPFVRENRYAALTEAAAKLIKDGHIVFSPITHLHPVDAFLRPTEYDTDWWFALDEPFMAACTELVILTLDGWEDSKGTAAERAWFEERGLPVTFMEPVA